MAQRAPSNRFQPNISSPGMQRLRTYGTGDIARDSIGRAYVQTNPEKTANAKLFPTRFGGRRYYRDPQDALEERLLNVRRR